MRRTRKKMRRTRKKGDKNFKKSETRISRIPKQNEGKPMCFHDVETRFHLKATYFG